MKNNKGFTLIELMVVVGIMAVISVLALFNGSSLNSSVLLSNTAYEISLVVRDAQVSSLGAKVLSLDEDTVSTSNQGVYFDSTNPNQFIFFADLNNSDGYNDGEPNQIYEIDSNRVGKILSICKIDGEGQPQYNKCYGAGGDGGLDNIIDVNVIFKRPNPEAYFYTAGDEYVGSVVINIGFEQGECKSVIIYKTGATQVDKSFCPSI